MRGFTFRKSIRAHPAADSAAIETELARNPPLRHPASSQFHHLLIAAMAPIPILLLIEYGFGRSRSHWHRGRLWSLGSIRGCRGAREDAMMRSQGVFQCLAQVMQEVPAIGHLDRLRRSLPRRFGIGTGPVATNNFSSWMRAQPLGDGLGFSIRQQIDHFPSFQITKDRSISMPFAPGPVIHAKYTR